MDIQPHKKIEKIKFSIYPPEMVRKMSATKVFVPDTYDDDGYPIEGGLVDTRLGVVDPGLRCKTCGGKVRECPGHFGHIDLVRPVIHVEFAKHIFHVLKHTCPSCYKFFAKPALPKKVSKKKGKEVEVVETHSEDFKLDDSEMIIDSNTEVKEDETGKKKSVKSRFCPHCNAELPVLKLMKPTSLFYNGRTLLPSEIRDWLNSISNEDIRALGFDPLYARPEWMILTVLLVPPVSTRPSITLETGERSEDDLTHKLVDIIRINQKLEANINAGAPQLIIEDLWELLQYHITTFFNNETSNIPPARHRSGRPLKTLAQRLKGKEGRFRYNLSGKRVNFSARTVISPDPRIKLTEVGVPRKIAEELTVPLTVNEWNLEYCKSVILGKEKEFPKYIVRKDGRKLKINPENREELSKELKVGSVIEREATDGDIVLFNRQPSLHRISMMGHEIRLTDGNTFRVNPVVITPYNADFDGDEMNLHIMQNPEARAEAKYLTGVDKQILSPRHGHAIIKPQEDHISGTYFLTSEKTKFTSEKAMNLMYLVGFSSLPKSDLKNNEYSGRILFSMLLPGDFEFKSKSKIKGNVVVEKGELVRGTFDSKTITELIEKMFLEYGSETTSQFLDKLSILSLEVISSMGLSVSLKDYTLSEKAYKKVSDINDKMEREFENLILQYKNKSLERAPGMSLKETLESYMMQTASKTRALIDDVVREDLGDENPSIIMANIGSRGSLLNAVQMSAVIAQQAVRNKRPSRGYEKRALVFFNKGDLGSRARGYIRSYFRKGLTPYEFYLHAMGGRESLVNTAIRTARSGYMQRRLINALQDLVVYEDKTVRDSGRRIVQFIYGGDGKDPMLSTESELTDDVKQDDVDTA
ncbi:MAG: DNA-directed RNA polymerase subunit A' [Candidatus ainarchaeum sp.]|nr:DNA-directed RNA polymerase subunit A' [Candidatus ainarchaeum sp.]